MYIRKIVAKNFIVPGVQKFEFDHLGGLIDGSFYNIEIVNKLNEILNDGWINSTMSLEKYYPKFSYPAPDMNMEIDVLIIFNDLEVENLSDVFMRSGFGQTRSKYWYYTIKAYYPYIFPIVTMAPALDNGKRDFNKMIGLGNHYDKFLKASSTKRDMLTVSAFYCVSKMRQEYFNFRMMEVDPEIKDLHNQYLNLLKSVYRFDEEFIKKVGQIFFAIDDGDIINYGDQAEYFSRNPEIIKWFDSIDILRESPEIRLDFERLMWEHLFSNLQINYTVRTNNDVIDIKQMLIDNKCLRPLDYRQISKIMQFNLKDEPLEVFNNKEIPVVNKKMERRVVIDEKTQDLINSFEELTMRQEEIFDNVAKLVDAKDGPNDHEKITKAELKRLKAGEARVKAEEDKLKAVEIKAAKELEKKQKEQVRRDLKQERWLRSNRKVLVIDSDNVTKELVDWK